MTEPRRRNVPLPTQAISLAPGSSGIVLSLDPDLVRDNDVLLSKLGIGIDPISNKDFVTVRLRVNGSPFFPFHNMTSQTAPATEPKEENPPIFLGHSVAVDVYAEVASGATGNTTIAAQLNLLAEKK